MSAIARSVKESRNREHRRASHCGNFFIHNRRNELAQVVDCAMTSPCAVEQQGAKEVSFVYDERGCVTLIHGHRS